ncbi:MAG: glycosyltransferase family 4 protein [Chloroherpetonaceae bacterium]
MKIGLTFPLDYSGISTYARHLINELATYSDLEIHLYTTFSRKKKLSKAFNNSPRFRYRNIFPNDLMLGVKLGKITKFIQNVIWFKESLTMDLIHQTNPITATRWTGRTVLTVHDIFPLYLPAYPGLKKTLEERHEAIFVRPKLLFVPTHFVKNDITTRLNVPAEKICVTYEAASSEFKRIEPDWNLLKKYDLTPETPFFFHIGRSDYRKNLERMAEAYFALPAPLKRKTQFVIASNRFGDRTSLNQIIERGMKSGEGGTVKVITDIPFEDLLNLYNAALGFMFVSIAEGFGIPLLEAMQCGCPVITSTETSLPEIAGNAALLVNPYDTDAIANAMRQLIESPELREDLRNKGFERAKQFSWKKMAEETLNGYKRAMQA